MSETKITKMVVQKEGRKLIFNPAGDIDLSQYYTKSEIDSKFNSYALKTEIPDTSDLATKTELNSVKSTATTANNTANSAKTTAQNALNVANSKSAFNINTLKDYRETNKGVRSYTPSGNRFGYVKPALSGVTTSFYQNGQSIGYEWANGAGSADNMWFIYAGNKTITCTQEMGWSFVSL